MFIVTLLVLLFVRSSSITGEPVFETVPLHFHVIFEQLRYSYEQHTDFLTDLTNRRFAATQPEELIRSKLFLTNESTTCEQDLQVLINATSHRELWALKVFDAWGKPLPSGLLKGNTFWIGNYDECVNPLYQLDNKSFVQQPFNTQYCALLSNPSSDIRMSRSNLVVGLCLPSSCSRQSIVTLIHDLFEFDNITEEYLHCSNDRINENNGFSTGSIVIIVVLSLLALVVVIGTIVDLAVEFNVNKHKEEKAYIGEYEDLSDESAKKPLFPKSPTKQMPFIMFLAEFSAIRTLKHIFTVNKKEKSDMFTFINGIRVLSLFWVILGHSFSFSIIYLSNVYDLLANSRNIAFQLITSGVLSVDTFFLLSGFLTAVLFVRQVRKEKLTYRMMILYYIHRYIRLTPTFILIMFVSIYLTPYFGQGPLYPIQQGFESTGCRNGSWWTSLLYIGNLVKPDNMCLGVTWYLFNDMQFHWIAPLALIPFVLGRKAIGYIVTIIFVLISIGSILGLLLYYPSLVTHALDVSNNTTGPNFFDKVYITPWCRISPYAIGLLTGFIVVSTGRTYRLNSIVQTIGSILAIIMALACIFSLYGDYVLVPGLNRASRIAYQALSRPFWSVSISWLLFLCSINRGGIVNRILSFPFWSPLARLNYAAYLIHSTVIFVTIFNLTTPLYYQPMTFVSPQTLTIDDNITNSESVPVSIMKKKTILIIMGTLIGFGVIVAAITIPLVLTRTNKTSLSNTTGARCQQLTFAPYISYTAKNYPLKMAVGDLNGDNVTDLTVVNFYDGMIGVYLGYRNGTFQPQITLTTGSYPMAIVVADLNRDNKNDIISGSSGESSVGVLLGFGNGSFTNRQSSGVGSYPYSLGIGDFDRNGFLDVIVGNLLGNTTSVLLGYGNGRFKPQIVLNTLGGPSSIVVADFNHDNFLDFAVTNYYSTSISLYYGYGNETFRRENFYMTNDGQLDIAVGDFNRDTYMDIVLINDIYNTMSVLLNYGNGTFHIQGVYSVGNSPSSIAVADFNGDTYIDIVVANYNAAYISILPGYGNGTFGRVLVFYTDPILCSVVVADFNGDGRVDIAVTSKYNNTLNVLLNTC